MYTPRKLNGHARFRLSNSENVIEWTAPMGEKKQRELWDIEDLQRFLKLPRSTTYVLVADGTIPSVRLGKHRRFIPDDVEAALRKLPK